MNCIKAQSLITPFINNKLNMKDTEEFLDHINSCPNCREELEVYFVLLTAMKQLDEDKNLSDNFGLELSKKIERAQERILHIKYTYYRKKAVLIIVMFLVAFLISFRYDYKDVIEENYVTESTFRLRSAFRSERNDYIEAQLQRYLKEHSENNIPIE